MNHVDLIGRLTGDPEVRATQNGLKIARYTLAVDRRGKDSGADFIRCAAFDKAADFVERYLHKGTKIAVAGALHTDSYTDRDGKKVYTTEVHVREHEFCEARLNAPQATTSHANEGGATSNRAEAEGFEDVPDNAQGLPFA